MIKKFNDFKSEEMINESLPPNWYEGLKEFIPIEKFELTLENLIKGKVVIEKIDFDNKIMKCHIYGVGTTCEYHFNIPMQEATGVLNLEDTSSFLSYIREALNNNSIVQKPIKFH